MYKDAKQVILAVDDDDAALKAVVLALRHEYSVRPLTSGDQALQYLKTQSPDLILLDYKMPGMDGFAVLEKLQASPPTRAIPVLFLTGVADDGSEVKALEMGAADYILKPVKPQVLMTRVRLQLELQRHRVHLEALVTEKTRKIRQREETTLDLLAKMTDLRDHDTGGHIERVMTYVNIVVDELLRNPREGYNLTREKAEEIVSSARLHDLGKIGLPDEVLLKSGRLNDVEFMVIKEHPLHSVRALAEFIENNDDSFLTTALDIARAHHEKWDGTGYPLGISGLDIPLAARIVCIADVYDALRSKRPYKDSYSHEKALVIILENSGKHFDPYLITVFLKHSEQFQKISQER